MDRQFNSGRRPAAKLRSADELSASNMDDGLKRPMSSEMPNPVA
ncbi:MAG: hypothetical protein P8J37_16955 [Fuerstiella sp.]|nr:hypothetical protein [Fuerstiella sp.]